MMIQKVYLQHDYLYASLDLIPAHALDGKDTPTIQYIVTGEPIVELSADGIFIRDTELEAREDLANKMEYAEQLAQFRADTK